MSGKRIIPVVEDKIFFSEEFFNFLGIKDGDHFKLNANGKGGNFVITIEMSRPKKEGACER